MNALQQLELLPGAGRHYVNTLMKTHLNSCGRPVYNLIRRLRRSSQAWLLAAVTVLLCQSAHAVLYLLEPFDYPVETLTNAGPWSNSDVELSPTELIVANDLAYPALTEPTVVNNSRLQWATNVEGIRGLPGAPLGSPTSNSEIYCSFVFILTTTNGNATGSDPIVGVTADSVVDDTGTTINKSSGVNGMVLYKKGANDGNAGDYLFGITIGSGTGGIVYQPNTPNYTAGATNFIVMKYHFQNAGAGQDTVALWVNPSSNYFGQATDAPPGPTDVPETVITGGTGDAAAGLAYFHVRGGASSDISGIMQMDNLRIGSTWADVTPTCTAAGVSNPSNQSVSPGQTATFSVTGTGTSPAYQWMTNNGPSGWVNINGATNDSYTTVPEVLADNGLQFECAVSVACDDTTTNSAAATLTVTACVAAAVSNPTNVTVSPSQTATFSVTPTGTSPTFQWQTNNGGGWFNIAGATNASYTTPPEVLANNGLQYECVVSVACDSTSATSQPATLSVICSPPGVVTSPTNLSIIAGQSATFSVAGSGSLPTYQWQTNNGSGWVNITGATSTNYTLSSAPISDNNLQFQCLVSVACDSESLASSPATLTVSCVTASSSTPANAAIGAGQTAAFSVTSDSSNPTYQWQTNNGGGWFNIPSATNASYTTPPEPLSASNLQFQCVVSESCDGSSAPSGPATLSVYPDTAEFWSAGSGNISNPDTWQQSFDGGNTWISPALYAPSYINETNVMVLSGDTVYNDINNELGEVVVQAGGEIFINPSTTLTIASGTGPTGYSMDFSSSGSVGGVLVVQGTLAINSNATVAVENNAYFETDQGGTYSISGTLIFNNGGYYYHNYQTSAGTIPTATWKTGSTCEVIGFTSSTATVAGATQNFYDFIWDCSSETGAVPFGGATPTAVNGDFDVESTGSMDIRLANNNSPVLDIFGNLNLEGGKLTLASGNGKVKLNVAGDVNFSGGSINNTNGTNYGTVTFVDAGTQAFINPNGSSDMTGPINWFVTNGATVQFSGTISSNLTLLSGGSMYLYYLPGNPFVVVNNLTNNYNKVVVDLGGASSLGSGTYPILNYQNSISGSLYPIVTIANGTIQAGNYASIDTTSTPNYVNLVVSTTPPPGLSIPSISCALSGTTLTLGATSGAPGAPFQIYTTTNLLLPFSNWTSVVSSSFANNGSFTTNLALSNVLGTNLPAEYFIIEALSPP
jgi:hypothetical protein